MILVNFESVQDEGMFYSALTQEGHILILRKRDRERQPEIVAAKLKNGSTMVAFQKLLPDERHKLESLDLFGGDVVAVGKLPFMWHYMKNDQEWGQVMATFDPEKQEVGAPDTPRKFDGKPLTPNQLANVQPLRPDAPRKAQEVK